MVPPPTRVPEVDEPARAVVAGVLDLLLGLDGVLGERVAEPADQAALAGEVRAGDQVALDLLRFIFE